MALFFPLIRNPYTRSRSKFVCFPIGGIPILTERRSSGRFVVPIRESGLTGDTETSRRDNGNLVYFLRVRHDCVRSLSSVRNRAHFEVHAIAYIRFLPWDFVRHCRIS